MAKFKIYCVQEGGRKRWYSGSKQAAIKYANERKKQADRGTLITVSEVLTADQGHKTMLINALNNDGWATTATTIRSYVVK